MTPYLQAGQIVAAIALIVVIMLQSKSMTFSGTFSNDSSIYRTRRGLDRTLFQLTIVLAIVFLLFSMLSVRFIEL
ncbi:MAG: preprotein translocase subunit SecG [Chloroflexota bacterium]|nr:preprotein translocase subunit SecG [Dehalococcoidia bacterium]MDW8255258.1 preprotein translocase subunit SecG [Chloroflexota bacterium]